ncbi:MAG: ribosome biogenesis GTP-binding protein YihA/YsxC [Cytophagales bacterium]|nr:ribosome biogenesis GTP-binding protein YihA/YsxC [Cytophagales bacterium]
MKIKEAVFIRSNTDYRKCPNADKPEYAFIGRSNVGKSSLINMLAGNKRLAKISTKPGKTQLINHFLINKLWYLVDLPGYGWAKVSRTERAKWEKMIRDYFLGRENLQCVFVLIDSRLTPQPIDIEFINWLGQKGIPCVIVFTKTDKITRNKVAQSIAKFKKRLLSDWEEMPQYFLSSAVNKTGRDEILSFIANVNENYKTH